MKVSALLFLLAASPAFAQGTFQNLDFEESLVDQSQPIGFVSVADALPGWTVTISTNQQSFVRFNDPCISSTCVSILGTNSPVLINAIEGNFSVYLQGGFSISLTTL